MAAGRPWVGMQGSNGMERNAVRSMFGIYSRLRGTAEPAHPEKSDQLDDVELDHKSASGKQ